MHGIGFNWKNAKCIVKFSSFKTNCSPNILRRVFNSRIMCGFVFWEMVANSAPTICICLITFQSGRTKNNLQTIFTVQFNLLASSFPYMTWDQVSEESGSRTPTSSQDHITSHHHSVRPTHVERPILQTLSHIKFWILPRYSCFLLKKNWSDKEWRLLNLWKVKYKTDIAIRYIHDHLSFSFFSYISSVLVWLITLLVLQWKQFRTNRTIKFK